MCQTYAKPARLRDRNVQKKYVSNICKTSQIARQKCAKEICVKHMQNQPDCETEMCKRNMCQTYAKPARLRDRSVQKKYLSNICKTSQIARQKCAKEIFVKHMQNQPDCETEIYTRNICQTYAKPARLRDRNIHKKYLSNICKTSQIARQ